MEVEEREKLRSEDKGRREGRNFTLLSNEVLYCQ